MLRRRRNRFERKLYYMNARTLFGILTITTAFAMNGRSQSCAPVTSGLVVWWRGESNALDAVGTNNGTIPDPVNVTFAAGEVGLGFAFSGTSPTHNDLGNEIDFGTNVGNFGTNDFTIDFWIKTPANQQGTYAVFEKRLTCNANNTFFDIHMGYDGADPASVSGDLFMDMSEAGLVHYGNVNANKPINDGFFHHAAFVRSGLTLAIYIDGVLNTNVTTSGIANIKNSNVFRAGQSVCVGVDGSKPFAGELDEVDVFNRALAPAEIFAIYQAGSLGKCGAPPTITNQPQSIVVNAYDTASFTVGAALGAGYQWSFNGTNIAGATSSKLTFTNVVQTNLGTYAVVVTNAFGATNSAAATLSMYPYIVDPFGGLVTDWGYTNTLSIQAWGTGPLYYQWYDNGNAINGATNQNLTLTAIQATNAGLYTVIVTSALGSATNPPAQVVVNPAGVSVALYPGVTISGVVGYSYTIQSTADLENTNSWVTVANLTLTNPVELWMDTNASSSVPGNSQRFYQVLPGP